MIPEEEKLYMVECTTVTYILAKNKEEAKEVLSDNISDIIEFEEKLCNITPKEIQAYHELDMTDQEALDYIPYANYAHSCNIFAFFHNPRERIVDKVTQAINLLESLSISERQRVLQSFVT